MPLDAVPFTERASPIPVALLPASAAPDTAPLAAPAAAPTNTALSVFFAFFKMPGEERLLLFLAPLFLPDFRADVLAAICTPL